MNLQHISGANWLRFEREHPTAYAFLLDASLQGEYAHLIGKSNLTTWERSRLDELHDLFLPRMKGKVS